MPKALADDKKKALKAAEKNAAAKGITPPKHARHKMTGARADAVIMHDAQQSESPDDNGCVDSADVVQSGSIFGNIANTLTKDPNMSDTKAPKKTQAEREAEAAQRIAAKEAKIAEATAKKAEREAAKLAKTQEAEARKAERAAKSAERKAAAEKRAAELKEAGKGYVGSMLSLADRVKQGVYVKGMNGQLRSSDELAVALEACPAHNVIKLALEVLGLEHNPYIALNVGQQSMNLRNKLRGAIKAGTVTLDQVREVRDNNGYATMEAVLAERKAKADERATKKAEREAAKQIKAEKKAEKGAEDKAPVAAVVADSVQAQAHHTQHHKHARHSH